MGDRVTLGEIIADLGDRSNAALLLVLALPMAVPIPAPGLSVIFGVPMVVISAQLALGQPHAWLPAALTRRSMARESYQKVIGQVIPTLQRLEHLIRPRAAWLAADWMTVPVGLVCMLLAVVIVLPIPFGHMVPGLAISILALAMLERDGAAVALGLIVAALGAIFIMRISSGALDVLSHWWLQ